MNDTLYLLQLIILAWIGGIVVFVSWAWLRKRANEAAVERQREREVRR
jgi:hypothetical protein